MILTHEKVITEWNFFFSHGSNGVGKNECVSVYLFTASFLHKI